MMFGGPPSPRATQLWGELDQLVADLNADIDVIVQELAQVARTNGSFVQRSSQAIQQKVSAYRHFLNKVAQGPDGPVDRTATAKQKANRTWQELIGRAYGIRGDFSHWPQIHAKITAQLQFTPQALYPNPFDIGSLQHSLAKAQDAIFDEVHRATNQNPQSQTALDQNAHADIPLAQSLFLQHMIAALRLTRAQRLGRPARFLDVGCGGGLKVLSASQCFYPAEGLDLDADYIAAGKALLAAAGHDPATVFEANALNFENYAQYDAIYIFRPISDHALLAQMEQHIVSSARPGTILIAPYSGCEEHFLDLDCALIAPALFCVKTSAADADALRLDAEKLGVSTRMHMGRAASIWDRITHELIANGFG